MLVFPVEKQFTTALCRHILVFVHLYFFTIKASIAKVRQIQERALRFILKELVSDYETVLAKSDVDAVRIATIRIMAVEIYKILNDMGPEYLSCLYSESYIP